MAKEARSGRVSDFEERVIRRFRREFLGWEK